MLSIARSFLYHGYKSHHHGAVRNAARRFTSQCAPDSPIFRVSKRVRDAISSNIPVVALETTIYTHGLPYPENLALASRLENIVQSHGGVPATIGVLDGVAVVGLTIEELERLTKAAQSGLVRKLSRRDLAYACASRSNGGTTIAGTMILAHQAGIKVFATGGLGGVHRNGEISMDISADLTELGRTPVAVVASGCKGFLDIPRTLEYLETQGVAVATFANGRKGKVDFPAFWSIDSGSSSPMSLEDERGAASLIHVQNSLNIKSGLFLANPIPEAFAIPNVEMTKIIEEAIRLANQASAFGNENTPFILSTIKELTKGKSVESNLALVSSNVHRATLIAKELAKLQIADNFKDSKTSNLHTVLDTSKSIDNANVSEDNNIQKSEVLVVGSLAVDYSCDYQPLDSKNGTPISQTSNPSRISTSIGGVGFNITKALHFLGHQVSLLSSVGEDLPGRMALENIKSLGMTTNNIETSSHLRTAQYVAVNDSKKDLVLAMADMGIVENTPSTTIQKWKDYISTSSAKWFIADANLEPLHLHSLLQHAKNAGMTTIFEPVSAAKSTRLFSPPPLDHGISPSINTSTSTHTSTPTPTFPTHTTTLTTPNTHELRAMHAAAASAGLFEQAAWWRIIDALGIPSSGARDRLVRLTSRALVDAGVPQQAIQLLPFVPTVVTKLGAGGVLVVRLVSAAEMQREMHTGMGVGSGGGSHVLARGSGLGTADEVGGVYVRLFPVPAVVEAASVVSVNGVGDTFLGALVSQMIRTGCKVEEAVEFAQMAAAMTLHSRESVSDELRSLVSS